MALGRTEITLEDLATGNAFEVIGLMIHLLKQLDRELGTKLAGEFRATAMAGDRTEFLETVYEYATTYAATTLQAGDLALEEFLEMGA